MLIGSILSEKPREDSIGGGMVFRTTPNYGLSVLLALFKLGIPILICLSIGLRSVRNAKAQLLDVDGRKGVIGPVRDSVEVMGDSQTQPPPLKEQGTEVAKPQAAGWLEQQFATSSMILMIGLPLLFPIMFPVMLILSGLTLASKHPAARRRARIVFGVLASVLALIACLVIVALISSK